MKNSRPKGHDNRHDNIRSVEEVIGGRAAKMGRLMNLIENTGYTVEETITATMSEEAAMEILEELHPMKSGKLCKDLKVEVPQFTPSWTRAKLIAENV